jgi:biotin operon repressor
VDAVAETPATFLTVCLGSGAIGLTSTLARDFVSFMGNNDALTNSTFQGVFVNGIASEWYHCSSHGTVLMHIAANPHSTIKEIAEALSLTKRSVWGTIGALRHCGQVHVVRDGRSHHYYVNMDAPFFHPTISGVKLGDLVGGLARASLAPGSRRYSSIG